MPMITWAFLLFFCNIIKTCDKIKETTYYGKNEREGTILNLKHTTDEEAAKSDSERLKRIHHRVCKVKLSEEVGIKYMQAWEEKYYEREEGREEGRLELLQELIKKKVAKGMSVEAIAEVIEEPAESVMQIIAKMEENKW